MTVTNSDQPVTLVYRCSVLWTALLVVALAGIWLISSPALRNMVATWSGSPEFSHAPLIPLISAFLVWQQKDILERIEFSGSWAGVLLALCGALLAVAGVLASLFPASQYGAVIAVYGVVLAGVGLKVFRRLWAPLFILLLMVPLPDFLLNNLSAEMQLISSAIGVWFMRLFGVSVYLEGNVIDLGGYQLQVAEACDGLRYLFPLMTLGFIVAYFFKAALWKRVLLFLSSIPITILMNSLRVGMIGIMVEHWGIGMAEGFLHEFQGWAVFMAECGCDAARDDRAGAHRQEPSSLARGVRPRVPGADPQGRPVPCAGPRPRAWSRPVLCWCSWRACRSRCPSAPRWSHTRKSFVDFPVGSGPLGRPQDGAREGLSR